MDDNDLKSKLANLTPDQQHDLASYLGISLATKAGIEGENDNSDSQD